MELLLLMSKATAPDPDCGEAIISSAIRACKRWREWSVARGQWSAVSSDRSPTWPPATGHCLPRWVRLFAGASSWTCGDIWRHPGTSGDIRGHGRGTVGAEGRRDAGTQGRRGSIATLP